MQVWEKLIIASSEGWEYGGSFYVPSTLFHNASVIKIKHL